MLLYLCPLKCLLYLHLSITFSITVSVVESYIFELLKKFTNFAPINIPSAVTFRIKISISEQLHETWFKDILTIPALLNMHSYIHWCFLAAGTIFEKIDIKLVSFRCTPGQVNCLTGWFQDEDRSKKILFYKDDIITQSYITNRILRYTAENNFT